MVHVIHLYHLSTIMDAFTKKSVGKDHQCIIPISIMSVYLILFPIPFPLCIYALTDWAMQSLDVIGQLDSVCDLQQV